ncbi:MAG: hypothetical protein NT010_06130 [Proteobacteria bacterium]|nr:hypothetical protein [Pseudomonadota bacterium]
MKDTFQAIRDLAATRDRLARKAEQQYTDEVNAVVEGLCLEDERIEHLLDGLLDFCFDPAILSLYKKVCRYYFQINPEATVGYVNTYREIWDSEDGVNEEGKEHE